MRRLLPRGWPIEFDASEICALAAVRVGDVEEAMHSSTRLRRRIQPLKEQHGCIDLALSSLARCLPRHAGGGE